MTTANRSWPAALYVSLVVLFTAGAFHLLSAVSVNARLESVCPTDQNVPDRKAAGWIYDRSSWTPLNWRCTIQHFDGTSFVYRPFPVQSSLVALLVATLAAIVGILIWRTTRHDRGIPRDTG